MTLVTAVTTDHEDPAPGARPAGAGLARGVASVRGQRGNEDVYNTAFIRFGEKLCVCICECCGKVCSFIYLVSFRNIFHQSQQK